MPVARASIARAATLTIALPLLLAALPAAVSAQEEACGPLNNAYGPFDYRNKRGSELEVVERFHFGPRVEALLSGQSGRLGSDIDYTLRAFPNHHRALMSVLRLSEKTKAGKDPDMNWSYECYFERAVRFQRDDAIARMLYATFLGKQNRINDAAQQLKIAATIAEGSAFTHYNIGMVYTDLKRYDEALEQAHKAYKLGFRQTGLRDRLRAAGKWRD